MTSLNDSLVDKLTTSPIFDRVLRCVVYGMLRLLSRRARVNPTDIPWVQIRRLLVIKLPYRMGDALLATPAIRAFRERCPQATLSALTRERNAEVFLHCPDVDEVLIFEKSRLRKQPWRILPLLRRMRRRFDLVVTLESQKCHLENDIVAWWTQAPYRIRLDGTAWGYASTNAVYNVVVTVERQALERLPEVDRYLALPTGLGIPAPGRTLRFQVKEQDQQAIAHHLAEVGQRSLIGLHPGAKKSDNRWPLAKFQSLAERLISGSAVQPIVIEGPGETVVRQPGWPSQTRWLRGLSVGELAALFQRLMGLVCNDTGVMHLAAAAGCPTIALFGPTDPWRWKPAEDQVLALLAPGRELRRLSVETVEEAVKAQCLKGMREVTRC